MTSCLRLEGARKALGHFEWGPIHLEVPAGYIAAIVGPNGSGKSTLMRMALNLMKPDQGDLVILGERYTDPETELSLKRRIGFVPDLLELHDDKMTVQRMLDFVSYWYPAWDHDMCRELCRKYELNLKLQIRKLSKGLQRRLAFILAISAQPELLLLDEPTSGLDPFAERHMMEDIQRFVSDGTRSVIFSTHSMDEVKRYADYVIFMYKGSVRGSYEKDALSDDWKMIWTDGTPEQIEGLPGVIHIEPQSNPVCFITSSTRKTEQALAEQGKPMIRTQKVELHEIFDHLVRTDMKG